MRKILVPIAIPVALAVGAALAAPSMLKRLFAVPQRAMPDTTPAHLGLEGEHVWIDGPNGKRLHAWFIPVDAEAPAVVVLHGWGGNATDMLPIAPGINSIGFHALFLDARTHGLSDNEDFMSMPRFAEDLDTALAWLHDRDDVTTVGVIGHSVGAAAAILAASRDTTIDAAILAASRDTTIDAVVAVASFAHPEELMWRAIPYPAPVKWTLLRVIRRMIGVSFDDIAPRNRIGEVKVPVLLLHGDADDVVPVEDALSLHEHLPGSRLITVPGGTHSDLAAFEPYFEQVDDFLRSALVGAGV
ncbi:MAG: alpha/beta fold hydrolase [Acidobacteria bacterium]|nr:alpha/beta fold hydrolase [Acidobacteriota bacterium]